ncbi:hypothetical protein [Roseateles sp.]|uniref:hypothetical protein n=1 Tax=Roseateles sp. TaxID=1971397 RepID=UPI003BAA8458
MQVFVPVITIVAPVARADSSIANCCLPLFEFSSLINQYEIVAHPGRPDGEPLKYTTINPSFRMVMLVTTPDWEPATAAGEPNEKVAARIAEISSLLFINLSLLSKWCMAIQRA